MAEGRVARTRRWLSGLLVGAALIAVVSGLVALLEPHVPELVGLPPMYLLAVLPVAIRCGAGPGLSVAVASVTTFNFLFVPPRMSFAIDDARYGITLGVFLVTAAVVAQLAARTRRGVQESARLSQEQAALRRVATLVAHAAQPAEVFAAVSDEIARLLEPDLTTLVRFEADGSATFLAGGGWRGRGMEVGRTMPVPPSLAPLRDGAVVRIDDLRQRPDMAETVKRQRLLGVVGCPIVVEGGVWGAFGVGSRSGAFPARTEQRLVDFTELIGTAIANTESRSEITRLLDEQAALRRVATLVARGVPPEVVFTTVAHEIGRVLGADSTVMLHLDADGGTTVVGETGHHPDEIPVGSRWELDPQLATAQVLRTGRSARRDDYRGIPGAFADVIRRKQIRSSVAIPIMVEGRIWGALGAGNSRERFPADTERRMSGFTDLIGTAIVNAESRAEITRLLEVQASLRQVATLVAREVPPEEIIPMVAEEIGRFVDADALIMVRLDPDKLCTVVAQSGPHPPELHVGRRWELDPDLAMAEAMRTAQPAYRDSYPRLSNPSADYIESMGIRSSVAIPITVDGRIWGSLGVSRIRDERFPADTAERMASFTELLATAVRNTRARTEIVRLLDEQAALRGVATVVAHGAPARDVFASVADEVIRLLDVDVAMLFRIHGETATFVAVSGWEGGPIGATVRTNPELIEPLEEGGAFRLDDIADTPEADDAMRGSGVRAIVGHAISVEGGLWGGFVAGSRGGPLPAGTEQRLASYTELIATAIANTENRAQILRLLEEQAALRRVATLVATGPSPEEVSRAVAEEVCGLLDLDDAGVCRYESDGTGVLLVGLGDTLGRFPPGTRWELDEVASSSEVWRTGHSVRIDAERWAHADGPIAAQLRKTGVRSVAATPVVVDGRLWGAVMAWSSRSSLPEDTEQRLARFTELVGMAIGNSENRSQTLRLLEEQAALRRVATLVATGPSPAEVSRVVADEVRQAARRRGRGRLPLRPGRHGRAGRRARAEHQQERARVGRSTRRPAPRRCGAPGDRLGSTRTGGRMAPARSPTSCAGCRCVRWRPARSSWTGGSGGPLSCGRSMSRCHRTPKTAWRVSPSSSRWLSATRRAGPSSPRPAPASSPRPTRPAGASSGTCTTARSSGSSRSASSCA